MCWWGRDGTSAYAQLRLLLWKNWVLKKRRVGATCCELLFPIGAVFILIIIRAVVKIEDVEDILPVFDKAQASTGVPLFLGSLACGLVGSTWRYPFQSVALAAGPNLVNGAEAPELQLLKTGIRDAFKFAGAKLNYVVPCGVELVNGTYVPAGFTNIADFVLADDSTIVRTYDSKQAMLDYIQADDYGLHDTVQTIQLGVVLDRDPINLNKWTYSMRGNSSDMPSTSQQLSTLAANYSRSTSMKYYDNHMLTFQWMIESVILSLAKDAAEASLAADEKSFAFGASPSIFGAASDDLDAVPIPLFDVSFVPFPIPAHKQDNFAQYVSNVFGLFLVVAFMWPFSRMVRNMVEEKEMKLAEGMKMMGLRNSMFWMSWVVTYLISFFIITILVVAVGKLSLFKYSDFGILFLFFFSFCLSLIALGCLVTTFFSRAKTAGTLSPFLLLAGYLPFFSVSDAEKSEGIKNLSCLLSPVAFSLGAGQIITFEGVFIGSQPSNAGTLIDNFKLSTAIGLMFFDAVLYGFFAWYLDKVWPREYGTHLKWYFLITPSYWKSCCSCRRQRGKSQGNGGPGDSPMNSLNRGDLPGQVVASSYGAHGSSAPLLEDSLYMDGNEDDGFGDDDVDFGADYEAVPENMRSKIGVKVRGLRKEFSRGGEEFVAVKGLNLNLYQGQCFVLLGHNGAGKTTTISMLTGMIETSAGRAELFGRDINTDMDEIRTFMGMCPQHDVLFPSLTVYEHLEFFGKLKGILRVDLHAAVMTAIEEVQLTPKINVFSADLSGGQRRRLSLAIALIGDSRVVFLDEPTSGVDPFSRRAIWDLLTKKKAGRIIVLTTHFMDEADQLGDRIGIMHHGEMKCCGTSLFLKSKYGVGYCMTLVKEPHAKVDEVTKLVQASVPEASMLSSVGSELSYSLPFSASAVFPTLLGEIDNRLGDLGLSNYGLSVTTMEEVFIKVAEHEDNKPGAHHSESPEDKEPSMSHQEALGVDPTKQKSSWCTHFRALLTKRYHIQKRDKKALCCQFLVPLVLLSLGLGLLRIPPDFEFPTVQLLTGEGGPYNLPNRIPYNSDGLDQALWGSVLDTEGTMEAFSLGGRNGTGSRDLYDFSREILDNRTQFKESRYGAFFGTNLNQRQPGSPLWDFTVLANASALHGMPAFATLGHQALLRNFTGDYSASISSSVQPWSWTKRQREVVQSLNGIFASIVISLAFTFIPASFAVFVVSEREYKSKHLQLISGVSMSSYWVANFVWDFMMFALPTAISCGIIYGFHNPELIKNFDVLVLSFFLYGTSVIPFTYLLSFLFTSHSTAQNVMIMIYILGGIIMTNTAVALFLVPSTKEISKVYLRHFFRLVPNFCLGDAIFYISAMPLLDGKPTKWDLVVTGFDLIYMGVTSFVYFGMTLAIDKLTSIPSFVGLFKKDPPMPVKEHEEPEDEDIRAERERLQQTALPPHEDCFHHLTDAIEQNGTEAAIASLDLTDPKSDLIRIEGLRKVYPKKTAVRDVFFGVPAGQCFGFLGVNGAGKTTTIKILTGDVTPSQGSAYIGGYDISRYPAEVRRLMGYCPQFDAIFDLLTAREHLNFYGSIRGIQADRLATMVGFLIDRLSLTEYADRPAGTYSGGNKRKLSVAIALIGNPPVVFLDEPSTGMDPVSRRFMWDFISETMTNRAVILTTHSMEECEALCSRIGILVNGGLKCVGSSQHLKSRFGRGFQVDISTAANDTTAAREFLLQNFPDAEQLEDYGGKMKYKILHRAESHGTWRLKDIFALIETHKADAGISEYSVGQTSLEQLFIQFARKGDVEEFGGSVLSEEEEAEAKANGGGGGVILPPQRPRVQRVASFGTEDSVGMMPAVTPSTYGYVPAFLPSSATSNFDQGAGSLNV